MNYIGGLYVYNRGYITKLHDVVSRVAFITASIMQRFVVGPPLYVVTASDLHPINSLTSEFEQ